MNYFKALESIQKNAAEKDGVGLFLRLYQNPHLALFDVATSLQQFLSHRPKIAIIRNGSSVVESLVPQFLKNQTPIQFKSPQQNTIEFLETIDKETCFVLWASENEITGEAIYSPKDIEDIHSRLSQKRIFSVQIVLSAFETNQAPKSWPYAILIKAPNIFMPVNAISSAVKFGEKFKAPSLIGNFQFQVSQAQTVENTGEKSDLHLSGKRFFTSLPGVSGSLIKSSLGLDDTQAFAPADLPTWVTEAWKNWWPEAERSEFLRGLIVLNLDRVVGKGFPSTEQEFQDLMAKHAQLARESMTWR